jgi:DNA-binding NarL/FixJ family response regulator
VQNRDASALVIAEAGRLRDGWRALLLAVPGVGRVAVADDAAAAMESVRLHDPDLVFVDLEPQDVALLRELKARKASGGRLRVIVVAGQASTARLAGADAILMRGAPATELFRVVGNLLRGSASEAEPDP